MSEDRKAGFVKSLSPETDDGPLVVIPAQGPVPERMFFRKVFVEWSDFPAWAAKYLDHEPDPQPDHVVN